MKKLFFGVIVLAFCLWAFSHVEKSDGVRYRSEIETLTNKVAQITEERNGLGRVVESLELQVAAAEEEQDMTEDQSSEVEE